MKALLQTLRNIFKIEDLKKRILYTLGIIVIYRLGSFVVIPGIDPNELAALQNQASGGLMGLLNMFSGGAFGNASIFALGIMPYISASIVVQLLAIAVPYFQKLQREGESGRRKMNQITRYLTVAILLVQGPAYIANLHAQLPVDAFVLKGAFFTIEATLILIAGTMFVMWLGEKITEKGIGNGISLIIMIGIIARLPFAFWSEVQSRLGANAVGGIIMLVVELVFLFLVFCATIALVQATRKVPVQYAKRIVGNKQYGGVRQYIPLKINAAGVMPIIFAQAIMFLPGFAAQSLMGNSAASSGWVRSLNDYTSVLYNVIYFVLVIAFTYVYVALIVNSQQYSEYLKRQNAFVPGVKPGSPTAEFIDTITSKITLPGAVMLAILAITPGLAQMFGINNSFAAFFGGSTILILVGVALDTLQQIESHLLMRKYDGLVKSGNIKGRTSGSGLASIGAGS